MRSVDLLERRDFGGTVVLGADAGAGRGSVDELSAGGASPWPATVVVVIASADIGIRSGVLLCTD